MRVRKIYSISAISFGAFLGGPLGAAYLMAKNFEVLEKHEQARRVFKVGVTFTFALIFVLVLLPIRIIEAVPVFLLPLIFIAITRYLAGKYQKRDVEQYVINGGQYESTWKLLGISLLIALITLVIGLMITLILDLFRPI